MSARRTNRGAESAWRATLEQSNPSKPTWAMPATPRQAQQAPRPAQGGLWVLVLSLVVLAVVVL